MRKTQENLRLKTIGKKEAINLDQLLFLIGKIKEAGFHKTKYIEKKPDLRVVFGIDKSEEIKNNKIHLEGVLIGRIPGCNDERDYDLTFNMTIRCFSENKITIQFKEISLSTPPSDTLKLLNKLISDYFLNSANNCIKSEIKKNSQVNEDEGINQSDRGGSPDCDNLIRVPGGYRMNSHHYTNFDLADLSNDALRSFCFKNNIGMGLNRQKTKDRNTN